MGHNAVLDQLKKNQILDLLNEGNRLDGRKFDEPRSLTIDTNVIPKAEGSARARLGDTEVVAGVKVQIEKPFPDTGDKGMLICTAEILPIAHPSVETGPPGPPVVELARVVDRGIRESGMIDMKKLVLVQDKAVIGIFSDNSVTDHDGNLFDACSYASTAAILSSKIPKYEIKDEVPVLVEGEFTETPTTTICSPILAIVTDTGIVVIGVSVNSPSTKTGTSSLISYFGIFEDRIAAVEAYEQASNKFPS